MSERLAKFWRQLRKEKWLLVLCFMLAFFAWQAIRRNISFPLPVSNIPVEVKAPDGWAVLEQSLTTVDVRFLGSREDIRDLNSGTLLLEVPVSNPKRGQEQVYTLEPKFVKNNPTEAKAVRFSPSEIEIKLDEKLERRLPVKAPLNGSLPAGLEIEQINYTPLMVLVKGARQNLEQKESIHTMPIDLNNRRSTFRENVRIDMAQSGGLQAEPDRVSVEFVLKSHSSTKLLKNVPVRILCKPNEQRPITVQPQTVNVTVSGPQQRIEQLQSADVSAFVLCDELAVSSVYEVEVDINLPSGLHADQTEPAVVQVHIP